MRLITLAIVVFIMAGIAQAQDYTNRSTCLDGAGDWSSGGTYTNISAIAQPGGVGVSKNGDMVNYAGFLGTFSMKPGLDTDGDGLDDEADPDNDNDSLDDDVELAGSAFSPGTPTDLNKADSDNDGIDDGKEAAAGTNPQDIDAFLRIISIADSAGNKTIEWTARDGISYRIRASDSSFGEPAGLPEQFIGTNTASGGSAPWDVTTNSFTDTGATNTRFYTVEVLQ